MVLFNLNKKTCFPDIFIQDKKSIGFFPNKRMRILFSRAWWLKSSYSGGGVRRITAWRDPHLD
jgi:hypothetical protein